MPHRNFLLKGVTKLFTLILVGLFITGFIACNNDKKEDDKPSLASTLPTTGFQMNCVILERSQVQAWVDSGWTKPGASAIKALVFQFYTQDAANANKNMQLIAYPGESFTEVKINGKAILKIDTTCAAKTLSDPIIFANNVVKIATLDILNEDGSLKDFDFIRLTPSTTKYYPYINFNIEIVKSGNAAKLPGDGTNPCPPYCP